MLFLKNRRTFLTLLTINQEDVMKKQANHQANIKNPNKGTPHTNKTWDKANGNRGKQLNPNNKK